MLASKDGTNVDSGVMGEQCGRVVGAQLHRDVVHEPILRGSIEAVRPLAEPDGLQDLTHRSGYRLRKVTVLRHQAILP